MSGRSSYTIVRLDTCAVWIRDDDDGGLSVTNDAERVCRAINADWPSRRIFYFDTIGRCDELVHRDGRFECFAPGVLPP